MEEIREEILQKLKIPEETVAYLNGIETDFIREWIYLCVVDKMPLEQIQKIMGEIRENRANASNLIITERMRFLRNMFRDNKELENKVDDMHDKVVNIYDLTSSVMKTLNGTIHDVLQEKDQMVEERMEHHMDQLQEKDQMIEKLRAELKESREEKHQQEEYFRSTREQLESLHKELKTTSQEMREDQRSAPNGNVARGSTKNKKKNFKSRWKEFFRLSCDKEAQIFI